MRSRRQVFVAVITDFDLLVSPPLPRYAGVDITAHGQVSESALERTLEVGPVHVAETGRTKA